jgi:hypothetical protein
VRRETWIIRPTRRDFPQRSEILCKQWCKIDPCEWKQRSESGLEYAQLAEDGLGTPVEPELMRRASAAGLDIGGPMTCLVSNASIRAGAGGVWLDCRSESQQPLVFRLDRAIGLPGAPLAEVNLGDLVQVSSYGRMWLDPKTSHWWFQDLKPGGVTILERNSCCPPVSELPGG